MKKLARTLILFAGITAQTHAEEQPAPQEQSRVVYVFDTGSLCTKKSPARAVASLFWRLGKKHPKTAGRALLMYGAYLTGLRKIENCPNGTTNIALAWLKELVDEGYDDMRNHVPEIVATSLNPEPNMALIEEIKKRRQQVPPPYFMVATNQDAQQHRFWRAAMQAKGVNVEELFDSTVTAWCPAEHVPTDKQEIQLGSSKYTQFADGSVMCPEGVTSASPEYPYILSKVIAQKAPHAEVVIYTNEDAKQVENAVGQEFAAALLPKQEIQAKNIEPWKARVKAALEKRGL